MLNAKDDVDIYSFSGTGGTEVWLDIDHTAASLDSVIELVNVNGQTLARSDNSLMGDETSPNGTVTVGGLDASGEYPVDHFSVNPADAGLRLTLPGATGSRGTYFVRVSSANNATEGAYELNVRLREVDEVPGTVVKFADIRFAQNGIDASGLVAHSPLQSEFVEPGDISSVDTALNLGSVVNNDRGEISVSGSLEPINIDIPGSGVDWYRFQTGGIGIVVDVDYADGTSNPNTNVGIWRVGVFGLPRWWHG